MRLVFGPVSGSVSSVQRAGCRVPNNAAQILDAFGRQTQSHETTGVPVHSLTRAIDDDRDLDRGVPGCALTAKDRIVTEVHRTFGVSVFVS